MYLISWTATAKAKSSGRQLSLADVFSASDAETVAADDAQLEGGPAAAAKAKAKAKGAAKGAAKAKAKGAAKAKAKAAAAPAVAEAEVAEQHVEDAGAAEDGGAEEQGAANAANMPPPPVPQLRVPRAGAPVAGSLADVTQGDDVAMHGMVLCSKCLLPAELSKVRLVGKGTQTYYCRKCSNKISLMHKHFGVCSPPHYCSLSNEDKVAFWRSAASTKEDLRVAMMKISEKYSLEKSLVSQDGEYLPLSVWESRGFSAADILNKSTEDMVQEHPVLGRCYRLDILSKSKVHETGKRELEALEHQAKAKKMRAEALQALPGSEP